jgi:hypothetical protein
MLKYPSHSSETGGETRAEFDYYIELAALLALLRALGLFVYG